MFFCSYKHLDLHKHILVPCIYIKKFTFIIKNTKVVENLFPEKISHELLKLKHFKKLVKNDS